ncbi:uncharacterized protein LOC141649722 [Silene latifolia]|uniref:uncharacterized protein LOC141649722 n=1 Tax=Silene latifolia TaxID=37657 RepID=UPI003D76BB3E
MYVCLKACKVGFLAGCRPFIGIDGCHLKGAYLGMCLVAVVMDANNNLYPVAWAVVEGLVEAFNTVTSKDEIRFCVRHIWANFKLQFSGPDYKEPFWKAAKSTSLAEFNRELEGIKFLSPKAHEYLASIPAKHWSRHAFSTTSKTNFLLNNMCESFNAVLKEARDKPIITLMEWIRRYVMKRHYDKRVGVVGYEGTVMPFVTKYLKWADNKARLCSFMSIQ